MKLSSLVLSCCLVAAGSSAQRGVMLSRDEALKLAPEDKTLLEVRDLIQASMKRAAKS